MHFKNILPITEGGAMFGYVVTFILGVFVMGFLIAKRDRMGSGDFNNWLKEKGKLVVER
jgi:hypothetical protein